jgi:oligosaccharide repeat unit polymerase
MTFPGVDYWLVDLIGLGVALVLLRLIGVRTGDWLTHAHLFSVLWGANLLVCQVALGGLLRPGVVTIAILFAAWWLFLAGTLWTVRRHSVERAESVAVRRPAAIAILATLIGLQCLAVAFEMNRLQLAPGSMVGDFFRTGPELRLSGVYSTIDYPFSFSIWRWGHVLYIPLAFILHSRKMISGKLLGVVSVLASLMAFGRYTRAPLVQLAVCSFVGWMFLYRPAARTRLVVGGAIAVSATLVFVATEVNLANLIGAGTSAQFAPAESMFGYIGGSPRAYESLLKGEFAGEGGGFYSLESINYLSYRLSIISGYPELTRPYANIPVPTNVYTFLDAFTLDLGLLGAFLGSLVTGALGGWLYSRLAVRSGYAMLVVYGYFAYGCVMALANNEFIRIGFPLTVLLSLVIDAVITIRPARASRSVRPLARPWSDRPRPGHAAARAQRR